MFVPDAIFGWGLLNGKKAAETITQNGLSSIISEESLAQGQTYTINVQASGTEPLQATIAWTDVPGALSNGTLNANTPALVNDLDLRITKGANTYYPWRLRANAAFNAVANGDDNVDNIEKVAVNNASGNYTITVTHKGTLVNGAQPFSLIVTGAQSNFAITSQSADKIVCSNETPAYVFNYVTTTSEVTNFTAIGAPAGATVTFSANSATSQGTITMTLSGLQNVAPGSYTIGFKGTNSTESEIENVNLQVFNNTYADLTLTAPANHQEGLSTTTLLDWDAYVNAQQYRIQIATDFSFTNIITDQVIQDSKFIASNLLAATHYYWRVLPKNLCGEATSNTIFQFDTGNQTCQNVFTATDFSDALIGDTEGASASVPIVVTGNMNVGSLTVDLDISHTYIEDFTVYLEGPGGYRQSESDPFPTTLWR
ncbi:hypothetical protein [Flavobacterium sp. 3HN19-14]|uniref:hypothetical protein n=1 Tax=Flavobacterium sp. 3HN19-14 TaxID=3448133 RepID=UPI003EDF32C4